MKASRAAALLLLVSTVWGSGFVVSQICYNEGLSPLWLLAGRFLAASMMMDILFFKTVKKLDRHTIINGSIIGAVLFLAFSFQNYGLMYSTPSVCAFVTSVYVVLIPFIDWAMTRKRPRTPALAASLMAMVGVFFFSVTERLSISAGALLTLIAAVLYAFQVLGIERCTRTSSPLALTIVMVNFTALISSLVAVVGMAHYGRPVFTSEGILALLYLGVFCTALCFLGQSVGQKYTSASKAGIIMSLEAVFGAVFSAFLLEEQFSGRMIAGAIIIFAAVLISETSKVEAK